MKGQAMTPLPRSVSAETLDGLAEDDPVAMRSRRDLQRVHRFMGTRSIVLRALRRWPMPRDAATPLRVLELGAGDGSLMLGVARALAPAWPRVELTLLDRRALVTPATIEQYAQAGWSATSRTVDVLDWAAEPTESSPGGDHAERWDVIIANLFLHHFEGQQLAALLRAIAARCDHFFACEPRRARFALAGSHLIGAIGANAVTRQDAVLSVHAGFQGLELSSLWPVWDGSWNLREHSAGLFSHCLLAERSGAG
ncbi:MAG: class I SAM-dependent methyltransferase [Thiomonas sp.]|uniref:Methyltransferase type 12 domain-containing protein n=1 Tax=mine drainage metagenome TaxID=410659 RepID=E6PJR2_9ZZZZ